MYACLFDEIDHFVARLMICHRFCQMLLPPTPSPSPSIVDRIHNIISTKNVERHQLPFGEYAAATITPATTDLNNNNSASSSSRMSASSSFLPNDIVNDLNKQAYKHLRVQWTMVGSRVEQLNAMKKGFFSIAALQKAIQQDRIIETARELALICCGDEFISPSQLQQLITFHDYPSPHQEHLLQLLEEWANGDHRENLRLFVEFATGLYSLPSLDVLEVSGKRIIIQGIAAAADQSRLPVAHTCFWSIDLLQYRSKEELRQKFAQAFSVLESGGEMHLA